MSGRTKHLALAVVLTVVDLAAGNCYCGLIWQAFSQDLFARAALLGLLLLWIASAAVLWLHVAHDLRVILRKRGDRLAFDSVTAPDALRRNSDV